MAVKWCVKAVTVLFLLTIQPFDHAFELFGFDKGSLRTWGIKTSL